MKTLEGLKNYLTWKGIIGYTQDIIEAYQAAFSNYITPMNDSCLTPKKKIC